MHIISKIIPPHAVKSASTLQSLLSAGYSRIPKVCLLLKNNIPTIHTECAEWLAINNCLFLLQEMFLENPTFSYNYAWLCDLATRNGSVDVLKYLYTRGKVQRLRDFLVRTAIESGHLETIKWIFDTFGGEVDWNTMVRQSYQDRHSHSVIKYLEDKGAFTLSHGLMISW
jgi:hypothetical protein